jgi:hypothetical protein
VTVKERMDRHDREIAAIRKLVLTGTKMMVRAQEERSDIRRELKELAAAQKKTEESLGRSLIPCAAAETAPASGRST